MIDKLTAVLVKGHQVASGISRTSPYPSGTIPMQKPYFAALGIDLAGMFNGTLNLSIAPHSFKILQADYQIEGMKWSSECPAENFSFVRCRVGYAGEYSDGLIYYPHPETKVRHFQNDSLIEVLCPYIDGICYGDAVLFEYDTQHLQISDV